MQYIGCMSGQSFWEIIACALGCVCGCSSLYVLLYSTYLSLLYCYLIKLFLNVPCLPHSIVSCLLFCAYLIHVHKDNSVHNHIHYNPTWSEKELTILHVQKVLSKSFSTYIAKIIGYSPISSILYSSNKNGYCFIYQLMITILYNSNCVYPKRIVKFQLVAFCINI